MLSPQDQAALDLCYARLEKAMAAIDVLQKTIGTKLPHPAAEVHLYSVCEHIDVLRVQVGMAMGQVEHSLATI